jgi:hypothetical protein
MLVVHALADLISQGVYYDSTTFQALGNSKVEIIGPETPMLKISEIGKHI